jgi:hypothetical protein
MPVIDDGDHQAPDVSVDYLLSPDRNLARRKAGVSVPVLDGVADGLGHREDQIVRDV